MRMLMIGLAASLALAGQTAAAPLYYEDLWGQWTVTAVDVVESPVQALVKDDPQYMGASLAFEAHAIRWLKGTDARPLDPDDDCSDPTFPEAGSGYAIQCDGAPWGPDAVMTPLSADTISLTWYDGAILTLSRD